MSMGLLSKLFDTHIPYLTTTIHLQIEFALWICTLLLTCASSLILYKHSWDPFSAGDGTFLLWVGLWLGRHFILRLVCTVTWVDPGNERKGNYGGSWRRRRSFELGCIAIRRGNRRTIVYVGCSASSLPITSHPCLSN